MHHASYPTHLAAHRGKSKDIFSPNHVMRGVSKVRMLCPLTIPVRFFAYSRGQHTAIVTAVMVDPDDGFKTDETAG